MKSTVKVPKNSVKAPKETKSRIDQIQYVTYGGLIVIGLGFIASLYITWQIVIDSIKTKKESYESLISEVKTLESKVDVLNTQLLILRAKNSYLK